MFYPQRIIMDIPHTHYCGAWSQARK